MLSRLLHEERAVHPRTPTPSAPALSTAQTFWPAQLSLPPLDSLPTLNDTRSSTNLPSIPWRSWFDLPMELKYTFVRLVVQNDIEVTGLRWNALIYHGCVKENCGRIVQEIDEDHIRGLETKNLVLFDPTTRAEVVRLIEARRQLFVKIQRAVESAIISKTEGATDESFEGGIQFGEESIFGMSVKEVNSSSLRSEHSWAVKEIEWLNAWLDKLEQTTRDTRRVLVLV